MPTSSDGVREQEQKPIEEELEELQRDERDLQERTDRLSLASGLTLIFSILALVIGVTALTIALIANGKGGTKSASSKASAPAAPSGKRSTAPVIAAGKLDVKLGEMFVRPSAQTVRAGKVTFTVSNTGKIVHEM